MYSTPPSKIIWQITYCICTCSINYNATVITYRRWSKLICHILLVVFCFKLVKSIFCTLWTVFAVIWISVVFGFDTVYLITFCFLQCFPHLESERKIGGFEAGNFRSLQLVMTYAHLSEFNNIIIIFHTSTRKVIKSYTKVPQKLTQESLLLLEHYRLKPTPHVRGKLFIYWRLRNCHWNFRFSCRCLSSKYPWSKVLLVYVTSVKPWHQICTQICNTTNCFIPSSSSKQSTLN